MGVPEGVVFLMNEVTLYGKVTPAILHGTVPSTWACRGLAVIGES